MGHSSHTQPGDSFGEAGPKGIFGGLKPSRCGVAAMALTLSNEQVASFVALQEALFSTLELDAVESWAAQMLRCVEGLFKADRSAFLLPVGSRLVYVSESIEPQAMRSYEESIDRVEAGAIRYNEDPLERAHARRRQLGLEVWSNELYWRLVGTPREEWPIYHEHVKPSGIAHGRAISVCLDEGETYLGLAYSRPASDPFAEEEGLQLLNMVLPAFKAGVNAVLRLHANRTQLARILDRLAEGICLFDLNGCEIHRNPKFEYLLAADPERERLIQRVRSLAAPVLRLRLPHAKSLDEPLSPRGTLELETETARYRMWASLVGKGLLGIENAVLVSVERLTPLLPSVDDLQDRHGLTPREAEVALLLAQGRSNLEIADQLGISPHTVRHHAEWVFLKLHIHSRKALALKLLV